MNERSVFKPAHPNLYSVICDNTVGNSLDSDERSSGTREWTNTSTMYIMLKYRYWQIKERQEYTLQHFHQTCSQSLLKDLNVNKTPTQIRDKVNNTRSSFHAIIKNNNINTISWENVKHSTISKPLFEFMIKFFDTNTVVSIDDITKQLKHIKDQSQPKSIDA
ncbi:Myb/SANT-like domain-containing protein [Entamoeba marina]